MAIDVLTVSSKGQVVLPAPIRSALSIGSGDKLAAFSTGDSILLKPIKLPTEEEFEAWLVEAQEYARSAGLTEEDVVDSIKAVRANKHS